MAWTSSWRRCSVYISLGPQTLLKAPQEWEDGPGIGGQVPESRPCLLPQGNPRSLTGPQPSTCLEGLGSPASPGERGCHHVRGT